ncbi:60S ribosomal export protein NMD3 [Candidatus Micrarchaeota archaeon]|nr:60S ribosomal export protein NMD3 [Candidatus Micrarchaeota archaeon]
MSALVCPKCGRTEEEVEFIDAFCKDDYPVRLKLPDRMELEQCTRCARVRLQGEWMQFSDKKIAKYIISKCKGDYDSAGYDMERQAAVFVMSGSGAKVERIIPLDLKKTICQQCSRMSGGYYQAIIQLRGDPLRVLGKGTMLIKRLENRTFISKSEEKDGGLDIYVGNSKAVVEVVTTLGLKTFITKKLVGRDQGKRLYRTTFLIRL